MKTFVLAVAFLLVSGSVFVQEYYSVVSDSLNVREGPGTNYNILGRIYKDEFVEVLETDGDWARIIFKDGGGYVNKNFIHAQNRETEAPPEQKIIEKNDNMDYITSIIIIDVIFLCFIIILFLIKIHNLKSKVSWYSNENSRINKEINDLKVRISGYRDEISKLYNENSRLYGEAELYKKIPDDLFNPRDPDTYKFATNNQLVIDGIPIYRYGSGENWTITRKPVSETDFVTWIKINMEEHNFQSLEEQRKYLRDYTQWYYDSCDMTANVYGGLKFTDAMLELSAHLSSEEKEKIGKIFCELLKNDPRKYRFQQELFNKGTGVDSLFFSNAALSASFQVEQDQMSAYYHECEFDTAKEVYEYFNNSEYLKKYPGLKEVAINDALKWKIDNTEHEENLEEQDQDTEGFFDPRNPETYQFAKNKPLVIDGIPIYHEYYDEKGDTIKKHVSEREFVNDITSPSYIKIQIKIQKWNEAINIIKTEFKQKGIDNPNDSTQGYVERIGEIYQELLKNPAVRLTKKQEKEYINDYIQQKIDMCTSHETKWTYGGYNFSEAQMDVLDCFSEEAKVKIGEIMSKALSEHKRSYQIKQDFFYSKDIPGVLGWDGDYFVTLHSNKGFSKLEEKTMNDFYLGFEEFASAQDVYDFFNSRPYLKKHPELKEKVIKTFLEYIEKEGDDE